MNIEPTHEQNIGANKMVANLIKNQREDFDLSIAQELHSLVERIQDKRSVSSQAARKIVRELLQHEVKAK